MDNESEKELNVADSTELVEDTTETAEELEEFTDTEENSDNDSENEDSFNTDDLNDDESEESEDEEQEENSQTKEENSKYAAARRKAEEQAKAKIDEAYQKGRLEAYKGKLNPYTNTEIKDITDIEVYEDMYKIAEKGGDPVKDYASYVADKKREEVRISKEKQEREEQAQKDIDEFSNKYPDVNISGLLNDEMFQEFAEGKSKSLVEIYDTFSKFKKSFRNEGIRTAKKTIANSISSPGSLGSNNENNVDYASMSREQFLKEVDKIKNGE